MFVILVLISTAFQQNLVQRKHGGKLDASCLYVKT